MPSAEVPGVQLTECGRALCNVFATKPSRARCFAASASARNATWSARFLEPEIRSLIDARDFAALREVFREWPPADVAEVILDMPEDEQVIIFRVLPHDLAADVFEYLGIEEQQKLLRAMAHEQVVAILNEMSPDDRTALLEELPSAAARQLIRLLTPEERRVAHGAARLSRRQRRAIDDAGFHRGEGGLDGATSARLRPRVRSRQRDAKLHLRRR